MTLLSFQRDMREWLTREDADSAARIGDAAAPGLRVHQNNYRAQLMACLEASFPKTLAWIGHEAFRAAAAAHIDAVPPSSWTLDAYARDFPATLARSLDGETEVAELALLELSLEEVFVSMDSVPLTVAEMGAIDWDHAVLRLTPAMDLLPLRTNAADIWTALAMEETPPAVRALEEPSAVLVWRQGHQSRFRAIDQIELQSLVRVRAGVGFATLCADLAEAFDESQAAAMAGGWLGRWISDGLIVGVEDGGIVEAAGVAG
ncbi:DNA-binding domain-containing protein [Sphingomonas sp.]|uniref:HvfC/BufC N-terminal domain-containing protein n=1 Tax=Sphingomonas sp. TaxID=28214 RepID=UPI003B3B228D